MVFVDVYLFGKGPYSGCMLVFWGCNRKTIEVLYTIRLITLKTLDRVTRLESFFSLGTIVGGSDGGSG